MRQLLGLYFSAPRPARPACNSLRDETRRDAAPKPLLSASHGLMAMAQRSSVFQPGFELPRTTGSSSGNNCVNLTFHIDNLLAIRKATQSNRYAICLCFRLFGLNNKGPGVLERPFLSCLVLTSDLKEAYFD